MGSSLFAGRILSGLLARRARVVALEDAGELLHYGLGPAARAGIIVAISQSGRSFETVRVVEALRAKHRTPVVALVNDPASPLANAGDVVLPLLAGTEVAIATKTYLSAMGALLLVGGETTPGLVEAADLDRAVDVVGRLATDESIGRQAAEHLDGAGALMIIGRGPALGVAAYGALTIKEAAAIPAEGMSGGAFRHGPVELTESDVGVIVLAPGGKTTHLLVGIANETAERGTPTWLITDADHAPKGGGPAALLISRLLPNLPEEVAPLPLAVPLQLAADALARQMGRRAGVTTVATKVTDRE
jgi:glucosamine--fructose-6-phosphate aminotransferase (isomerizing)